VAPPFYVTTPIYYVNGRPHIGHAYTTVVADVFARWHRAAGGDVFFLTGTDEHGQKVLQAATARGRAPKEHCDELVVAWKALTTRLGVSHDRFLRTTDEDHVAVVQQTLAWLLDRGDLYRAEYTGWYSTAAERFWTEKDLVDGKCPDTGTEVVRITEANWFFRMGKYQADLLAHIEAHPDCIRPASRRNEVRGFLQRPLEDLCISRPRARMAWGIPLPFDPDYVTYVWFDALLNYLTGAGWAPGRSVASTRWPAALHLVGKDILTTHAVYWTTMLLALGLPLPDVLLAHGWWVSADGRKMSKSFGNAIDVDRLCDAFGVDALRWFLLREIELGADGSFSYDGFLVRYNADLANDLGNLAHRGLSMTVQWLDGRVPAWGPRGDEEAALDALARRCVVEVGDAMGAYRPQAALDAIAELVRAGNKYVDQSKPWALRKAGRTDEVATVQRATLELCRLVAVLALAVMPERMAELLGRLGDSAEGARASLPLLLTGADPLDGLRAGAVVTLGEPLFPRFRELPPALAELFASPEPTPMAEPTPTKPPVTYDDFARLDLRVGHIQAAAPHPNADRLLVLTVDTGEAAPRTIVAGIRSRFQPEQLVGRHIVVVANLAPAKIRGVESQGMLLAASAGDALVDVVSVDAPAGSVVR
jgi:methionyl-tRNA synthetase